MAQQDRLSPADIMLVFERAFALGKQADIEYLVQEITMSLPGAPTQESNDLLAQQLRDLVPVAIQVCCSWLTTEVWLLIPQEVRSARIDK